MRESLSFKGDMSPVIRIALSRFGGFAVSVDGAEIMFFDDTMTLCGTLPIASEDVGEDMQSVYARFRSAGISFIQVPGYGRDNDGVFFFRSGLRPQIEETQEALLIDGIPFTLNEEDRSWVRDAFARTPAQRIAAPQP